MVVAYHSKGEEIFYGYGDDLRYKEHSLRVADFWDIGSRPATIRRADLRTMWSNNLKDTL